MALQRGKYLRTGERAVDIAVVQLPHISNFTDFNALAAQPDVRVHYVRTPEALHSADAVILPGSKNTLSDLTRLRECGLAKAVLDAHHTGVPVIGVCGGYQMLGEMIIDEVESGLGTLPVWGCWIPSPILPVIKPQRLSTRACRRRYPAGWRAAPGLRGYEIHMGETTLHSGCRPALWLHKAGQRVADGAVSDNGRVFGTYLHGLFDSDAFTRAFINDLRQRKGLPPLDAAVSYAHYKAQQFDLLASAMREHVDIKRIYQIMQQHQEPAC
ncbi:hypothetical protein CWS02_09890 [Enterobacter sp. EA-1]|nr:hypothetical protein CWS02_09890 [Enterobacter sp. EA-1]